MHDEKIKTSFRNRLTRFFAKRQDELIILAVCLLIFHRWFTNGILTSGDWSFHWAASIREWLTLTYSWTSQTNLGGVDLLSSNAPIRWVYGVAGHLGASSEVPDKIAFMIPILLAGSIGGYYLFKDLLHSRAGAAVALIVYMLNTYTLGLATGQLTLLAGYNLSLIAFRYIKKVIDGDSGARLYAALTSLAVCAYEFRVFYILLWISFFYFIYVNAIRLRKGTLTNLTRSTLKIGIVLVVVALLNAYWAFGMAFLGSVASKGLLTRGLFGSEFLNLSEALALFHPFWTGGIPTEFVVQPIPIYFWLIPTFAVAGIYLNRKDTTVLFFGFIALLGVMLTKQEAAPFTNLYAFLYERLPGFGAFREASKFYFLIALGYAVLIGSLARWLWTSNFSQPWGRTVKYLGLAAISSIFLINSIPLITGSIGTLYQPRSIPDDYKKLATFIEQEPGYFRTLWVPTSSRWGLYSSAHPRINVTEFANPDWQTYIEKNEYSVRKPIQQQNTEILGQSLSGKLLDDTSVKYVVVPIRDIANNGDFIKYYGDDRQYFIDQLDRASFLKRTNIGTRELAVYENLNFRPYVTAFTQLTEINDGQNANEIYRFTQSALKSSDFYFAEGKQISGGPVTSVTDIFQKLSANDIKNRALKVEQQVSELNSAKLYVDSGRPSLGYEIQGDRATFRATNLAPVAVNGRSAAGSAVGTVPLNSIQVAQGKPYYFAVGNSAFEMSTANGESRNIGVPDEPVSIYVGNTTNLISNPSFEEGPWNEKVLDCNPYSPNAQIGMKINAQEHSGGVQSLELSSQEHIACSRKSVDINPEQNYLLEFEYKTSHANQSGYEIKFNDPENTTQKFDIGGAESWKKIQKIISTPPRASRMELTIKGYPDDTRQWPAETYFDSFKVLALESVGRVAFDASRTYVEQPLPPGTSGFEFASTELSYKNLVLNPSLESGLWQQEVGDCNNFDSRPILGMKLSKGSKTQGEQALQLEAQRHTACTGPPSIPIDENANYLFSFDYQSSNSQQASYVVSFNDPASTYISEDLPIKDQSWNSFARQIRAPYGASQMTIAVYSKSGSGNTRLVNRYDNFSVTEIPDLVGRYISVVKSTAQLEVPSSVKYESLGLTKKSIHISGAKSDFYLAMSETYHPGWKLEANSSNSMGGFSWLPWVKPWTISEASHFKLNAFENGWYVKLAEVCAPKGNCTQNPDGSYDIELIAEFFPQRWYYIGIGITGITLVGCAAYYIWTLQARRRDRKATQSAESK